MPCNASQLMFDNINFLLLSILGFQFIFICHMHGYYWGIPAMSRQCHRDRTYPTGMSSLQLFDCFYRHSHTWAMVMSVVSGWLLYWIMSNKPCCNITFLETLLPSRPPPIDLEPAFLIRILHLTRLCAPLLLYLRSGLVLPILVLLVALYNLP